MSWNMVALSLAAQRHLSLGTTVGRRPSDHFPVLGDGIDQAKFHFQRVPQRPLGVPAGRLGAPVDEARSTEGAKPNTGTRRPAQGHDDAPDPPGPAPRFTPGMPWSACGARPCTIKWAPGLPGHLAPAYAGAAIKVRILRSTVAEEVVLPKC